jgi:CheY-like chemotaxis protein
VDTICKVLAVDDCLDDRRLIQRALGEEFEVTCCGSGEEALVVLEAGHQFDVIVADWHLPGISGIEFIERAASLQPDAGRLMITGDPNVDRTIFPVVTLFKPVPMVALKRFVGQLATLCLRRRTAKARASRPTDPLLKKPS